MLHPDFMGNKFAQKSAPVKQVVGTAGVGPTGPTGVGPTGPAGVGPTGPAGFGPTGPAGPAGPAGGKGSALSVKVRTGFSDYLPENVHPLYFDSTKNELFYYSDQE